MNALTCVLCGLLSFQNVLANGGGYHHGVEFSGGIAPFTAEGTEKVQILDEKLDIQLGFESAKVTVEYKMKNISDSTAKVKFGFPVEDVEDKWSGVIAEKGTVTVKKKSEYCRNYKVEINGKAIKSRYLAEPFAQGKIKPFKGSGVIVGIEGWLVSQMKLKKGEEITLRISYDSDYDVPYFSISDDWDEGPWKFKYRLSSGAIWHGPIKRGRVRVTSSCLNRAEIKLSKPVNRFKKVENGWEWSFENLEPTLQSDIEIHARPAIAGYPAPGNAGYCKLGKQWLLVHSKYQSKASSTLSPQGENSYGVGKLQRWEEGAWAEGAVGQGIGESIQIVPDKASILHGLYVVNGYVHHDKPALFKQNSRVKDVELLINGKIKRVVRLADSKHEQRIALNFDKPVKSLKLTINSVYPGTKYKDTCISSLNLIDVMKKAPKTYGAR